MKKRFLLPIMLSALCLGGCFIEIEDANKEDEQTPVYVVDTTVVDKHYTNYDLNKTGGRLVLELQRYMFDKHTKWISYGQVNSYYSKGSTRNSIEAIADGSPVNEWYYTGKELKGTGGSNREHVWACANSSGLWTHTKPAAGSFSAHYVDNSSYIGGGSDLYHVRLCEANVNTARGNSRFVSFDDPEWSEYKNSVLEYGENNGKYNIKLYNYQTTSTGGIEYANQAEPDDHFKGDVARLILYVWIHYTERDITPEGSVKSGSYTFEYSDMTGSLSLSDIMGYDSEARCLEVIKSWCKIDPPSSVEKLRNDTVQKIQGNRNPFVDYPNLVDQL